MSTPAGGQSAQGLEAQLQRYKEAAVNLPRLVKKFKSLEAQYSELRKHSDCTAAALESSRQELSQAQSASEALKESLSKVQSEKSALAVALEESKRENVILQNRILRHQPAGDQAAGHPDSKLLKEAVREVSALRSEVCSLRNVLAQSREGAVFSELAAIRGQMSQLLQRCPKDDGFLATTTSRACTPVHESLASPPLQSMTSLYTHARSGDAHRACAPLVPCYPQDTGKYSTAQPSSTASAFTGQVAHLHSSDVYASDPQPLPSPSSTQECMLNASVEPPSPLLMTSRAPSAALPAPPPSPCSHLSPSFKIGSTPQPAGKLAANSHPLPLPSASQPSSVKRPTPQAAGTPVKRSVQDGSWSPRKRDREESAPPAPPPRACKSTQKKKHKTNGDSAAKGEDEGFMKLQDMPSATQKRWKPQSSEPQRKMMQFGSGTVKSTTVSGSCFSILRKRTPGSEALVSENDIQLKSTQEPQQHAPAEVSAGRQAAQPPAAAQCGVSAQPGAVDCPSKVTGKVDQKNDLQNATDAVGKCSTEHSVEKNAEPHDPQGEEAILCAPGGKGVVQELQAAEVAHVEPLANTRAASACTENASGGSDSPSPAEGPESFIQSLLNAAPQLLPNILTVGSIGSCSTAAAVEVQSPKLCECTQKLCKAVTVTDKSDKHNSSTRVAADLAAHWEALDSCKRRVEFAVELVSEVVQCVSAATASMQEHTVLAALAAFKEKQSAHCKLVRCNAAVGTVCAQLNEVLGATDCAQFDATHCASVLWQAQAQTSDSESRICEVVAEELCKGVDAAVKALEQNCETGEIPEYVSQWFTRMQLAALVGLLAAHERQSSPSQAASTQHLMQALTGADDLAGAMSSVFGGLCGDLGRGSVFHSGHDSIVSFWNTSDSSNSDPLPIRPSAVVLQVALCVTAGAAKRWKGDSITALCGEIVWDLGQQMWGWCPTGASTMQSLCGGLMHMLESAGVDALSPVWAMFKEQEQLTGALDARASSAQEPLCQPAEAASSDADSSSEDSSASEDGRERGASDTDCSTETILAGSLPGNSTVHAVLQDVRYALKFAAQCCGWKWTRTLLDDTVWPVLERLQKVDSTIADDVRRVIGELIGDLLGIMQCLSNGDIAAAEYVTTVQEALQFVR